MAKRALKKNKIEHEMLFGKKNYLFLIGSVVLIALGLLLMSGGGQEDPNVWHGEQLYSFRRITLAVLVMLAGYGLAIYAIMKRFPAENKVEEVS